MNIWKRLKTLCKESSFFFFLIDVGASLVPQTVKISACNAGETGSVPGSGRSPGGENPLQYSCLENSTDGGAWW